MNEFEPWENYKYDDEYGNEYSDSRRSKNKRIWGVILFCFFSAMACAFALMIRSFRSTTASTTRAYTTEIVVVHTATPGLPPEGVDIGLTAPDFTLKTIDGASVTLSSLRGRAVLLNFWATWCAYCRDEMPAFQNVYNELKGDSFIVVTITEETGIELENVIAFKDDYHLTFPILLDEDGAVNRRYYVTGLPRTLLITPKGTIHKILLGGPITEDEVKRELSAMLP